MRRKGDPPRGIMTSVPFKVTHPFAAFLVGGGAHSESRVELVLKANDKVLFQVSGHDQEDMELAVVDLKAVAGQEIFVRIIDDASGGWGHINFDNFRFYDSKPAPIKVPGGPDVYAHAGLSPEAAAAEMTLPEGFKATLFAGEPDVVQPIAMALDDRGRLWIAEAYSYPIRLPDAEAHDRILIFEDTNGDGKFDKRTVFADKLNLVSGIAVGTAACGSAPPRIFCSSPMPMATIGQTARRRCCSTAGVIKTRTKRSTRSSGVPMAGCTAVTACSRTRTSASRELPTRSGSRSTAAFGAIIPRGTNSKSLPTARAIPGESISTTKARPSSRPASFRTCYYVIQGARYERQAEPHINRFTFEDIKTIADHRHYASGSGPHAGNGRSDSTGGGHAHAGAMVYLGGAWPAEYRGEIFMNNIHGQRINMDLLKPSGSGYVGSHGPDFCMSNDSWSQILNLRYGPDGQVYMIDWYDKNACHHGNVEGHDRSNGRIFKITHGTPKPVTVDLAKESDEQLAQRMLEANDWYVRHARRQLAERAARGPIQPQAIATLKKIALETCRRNTPAARPVGAARRRRD